MKTTDLHQVTGASANFGVTKLATGAGVIHIDLTVQYLHAGANGKTPPLTMSPDQARSLAQMLLRTADQAEGTVGGTPPKH